MKGIKNRAFVPDKAARIVDAHIHVWSPDRKKYPLAPGFTPDDLWLPSFTPDDHFQYSRRVGKIRLNLVQMTWYGLDHSYILDLIASDPDTYTGIGIVSALSDVSLPDPGKAMLALAEGGIRVSWSSLAPFRPWEMARRPTSICCRSSSASSTPLAPNASCGKATAAGPSPWNIPSVTSLPRSA